MNIAIASFIPESKYTALLLNDDLSINIPLVDTIPHYGYDIELFRQDNDSVCNWFNQLKTLFASWQKERHREWDPARLVITGSRGFGASYIESDIECAIVSEQFEDFIQFCVFLNERYAKTHHLEALKTQAGLPLFTIRKTGVVFNCPLLHALYPQTALPKLEVTFRHPLVHHTIQTAGQTFFNKLPREALTSYIFNKYYITSLLKNPEIDGVIYDGKSAREVLLELKSNLMHHIMVLEQGELQTTPEFNMEILNQAIQAQTAPSSSASHQISNTLRLEAEFLLSSLMNREPTSEQVHPLHLLAQDNRLAPDDWALGQECFAPNTPWFQFFKSHRDELSSQLKIDDKYYTCVPIITFDFQGELHVLLMENPGLQHSSDVNETEWTAHGVRVDANEQSLITPELWLFMRQLSQGDYKQQLLLAAAWRRIAEMGINVTKEQWSAIHPIDRNQAGFTESNPFYNTSYIHVHLGERIPEELVACCHATTSSRYGHWTQFFKVNELITNIKEIPHPTKQRELYQLTHHDKTLTVRITSMRFILALSMLAEITKDDNIQTPWDIHNPSPLERAFTWITNREGIHVQPTLFSPLTNRLSSAIIHAFAKKAGLNEEDLAILSIKPERLVLHQLLAHLVIKTQVKDKVQLQATITQLLLHYQEQYPGKISGYEKQFNDTLTICRLLAESYPFAAHAHAPDQLPKPERIIYEHMLSLYTALKNNKLSNAHNALYHLVESDTDIALLIAAYTVHHEEISSAIKEDVDTIIQQAIINGQLSPLEIVPLEEQQFFGVTGPVASGKSVSEGLARQQLKGMGAAFISSDEWNEILVEILNLGNFSKLRGGLTLSEAYRIKKLMWELLEEMAKREQGVHTIQEAMSPASLRLPAKGKISIFVNTASPEPAIARVQARGDLSGRYVSGSATFSSYRWPWHQLIIALEKGMAHNTRLRLAVIDTDICYACRNNPDEEREQSSTIATLQNNTLNIHHLEPFIAFINRGYMINPSPRNAADGWLMNTVDPDLLLNEIKKLFNDKYQLTIQRNSCPISYQSLCAEVLNSINHTHSLNNITLSGEKNMLKFNEWLNQLSATNKELLAYYGTWQMSDEERKSLSSTGIDEFDAIRRSLYLLHIVLQGKEVDATKESLLQSYEFNGFEFQGISDSTALEKNIVELCKLRDEARIKWPDLADEYLVQAFIVHDLGKIIRFITDHELASVAEISAVNHELYVQQWLADKPFLNDFSNQYSSWVDVFDGLGHNPQKLSEAGYVGLLSKINQKIEMLRQLNTLFPEEKNSNNIEVFNKFLYQEVKTLNLPHAEFSFLIAQETARTPWSHLSRKQQSQIIMLVCCGPFVFLKTTPLEKEKITREFINLWQSGGEYQEIVDSLIEFMIANMESDKFKFLYNITGLLHHNPSQGISHFSLNGTVQELFTVFFPFMLQVVNEGYPEIPLEIKNDAPNKFQALQRMEIPITIFSDLLENATTPQWQAFDFASKSCKDKYEEILQQNRLQRAEIEKSKHADTSFATPTCSSTSAPGSSEASFFAHRQEQQADGGNKVIQAKVASL